MSINHNHNFVDRAGIKYGRLTAIEPMYVKNECWHWRCKCECGKEIITEGKSLGKRTNSCGCLQKEIVSRVNRTHGGSWKNGKSTKEYDSWRMMKIRTSDRTGRYFKYYAARGITVCERWIKFENFLEDMGKCPDGYTSIDRIDNSKGYFPGNCRWATREHQQNNTRRNKFFIYQGQRRTLTQWCREFGINPIKVNTRLVKYGWHPDRAFERSGLTFSPNQ